MKWHNKGHEYDEMYRNIQSKIKSNKHLNLFGIKLFCLLLNIIRAFYIFCCSTVFNDENNPIINRAMN